MRSSLSLHEKEERRRVMLSRIEQHYNKHKEDLRLLRRHGVVEFEVTMMQIRRQLELIKSHQPSGIRHQPSQSEIKILDIGAGTGRYAMALKSEGYNVECVELVQRNIDVMLQHDPTMKVIKGDARHMPWIADDQYDIVLLLGPLYHLIGDAEKQKALAEAKRVMKPDGRMFVAYLMNDYSILTYCFDENRMPELAANGFVDSDFHVRTPEGELYDYVRLEDINRLNAACSLKRELIFSPEGAADFMRTQLNRMSEDTFKLFIEYQKTVCERPELIGAGSHTVDVLMKK